jgi:hypothetical protein
MWRRVISMLVVAENLTPNPFPSGKGNRIERSVGTPFIWFAFDLGKGLAVRG